VITDHHECKEELPRAVAVVDPHREDGGYPHKNLSGVGIAFKLASALAGDQETVLRDYADMVCLGTVADVMLLQGENRVFVSRGLQALRCTRRPGLAALIKESGCTQDGITASTIGFILAPRINAAGRMGQIELAVELFLTEDTNRANELARALCELNRRRQAVESEIYDEAVASLPGDESPDAIVLASESWHQGVVGIVASRMAEEFCCPTFLICLDGEHGKASSRSYGGFNLFSSLTTLAPLLESYGGHELAAGFTISRQNIDTFRQRICQLAAEYYAGSVPGSVLEADCAIPAELLTIPNVLSLEKLEPCGTGCPRPVFVMENLKVDRVQMVGGGRHMRLRLKQGRETVNAIYFSAGASGVSVATGELVDVAFCAQINEFKGVKSVQMNLLDIRPACSQSCDTDMTDYQALRSRQLTKAQADRIYPDRAALTAVWRYLDACPQETVEEDPLCLCRKIVRRWGKPLPVSGMMACLDIFRDVGLLDIQRKHKTIGIRLHRQSAKADLNSSQTLQYILERKEV
jgi:single-stranded-DNA-specific exonuclease